MIPAGRAVATRADIAAWHGLSWRQACRQKPWARAGHPSPITRGRPTNARPQLWDAAQARAFAAGELVPVLATEPSPGDLLDRAEAAAHAGVHAATWERHFYAGRIPAPDQEVAGAPYWRRDTIEDYRAAREPVRVRRGHVRAAVAELLDQEPGITVVDIARRLDIAYGTAHRHVSALRVIVQSEQVE